MIDFAWAIDHIDDLTWRTLQHLLFTAIAVGVGFAISLGLAIVALRRHRLRGAVVTASGILYTIPSLALFAALVPVTGLSILTAEIPLTLYTLLIFLRNILAGLDGVPGDVIEAADAMGYTGRARLMRVELPLALPLVIAGVRLASVSTIGLVTVSGILGDRFGGLGFFIFEGYAHVFPTEVLFGAIPSVVLALLVDVALQRVQRRLTPWTRPIRAIDPGRGMGEVGAT
ncbi:MAG TPA: ABC transporter permease [Candidatus Limnocylindrales bacterium]|nr:ABC transporter permease [Candidatus Limnocylindrales bacterium]